MAYTEEDYGQFMVFLVVAWGFLLFYILDFFEFDWMYKTGIMVPTFIALFLGWVRYENRKIAKDEAAAASGLQDSLSFRQNPYDKSRQFAM